MTVQEWIGLILALLVMCVGLLGSILPGLPGAPLVLVAAIGHRLYFGQESVSNLALVLLVGLTGLSLVLEYLASLLGAKKLGATWRGLVGAVIGAIVGLFFGPPGIVLGPFLGALAFEMLGGREFAHAARAGMGAVIGLAVGAAGKLACCVAMIALFLFSVLTRSTGSSEPEAVVFQYQDGSIFTHDTSLLEVRLGMDLERPTRTERLLSSVRERHEGLPELREL